MPQYTSCVHNTERAILQPYAHQSDTASTHSLFVTLLNYAQDCIVNWIEVGAFRRAKNLKFHRVTMIA